MDYCKQHECNKKLNSGLYIEIADTYLEEIKLYFYVVNKDAREELNISVIF